MAAAAAMAAHAMSSLRSTALEPTRAELRDASLGQRIARLMPVYGLLILTVLLILLFSLLLPETFPTLLNLRSILSDKSLIALLSLAAMIPMMTGKIDLTVGYGIVLWHILAITLQIHAGLPWPVAVVLVILAGAAFGWFNGLLVEVARIDSFIATLGTGTVIYAVALWYTGGRQMIGNLPPSFFLVNSGSLFGMPITAFYVLAIALVLWIVDRVSADRPLPLRHRRQPARRRAQRHPDPPLRDRRVHGVGCDHRRRRRRARGPAADRPGQRRPRFPAAGAGRRLPRLDHDQARPGQCLGHDRRRRHPGGRHLGHPAVRRRLLGRADVQRRHPADRHRLRRLDRPAPRPRHRQGPAGRSVSRSAARRPPTTGRAEPCA